jgi:hypothetical protein
MQVEIGEVIKHKGKLARVVRLVRQSISLIETDSGEAYLLEESYIQLMMEDGEPDFIVLSATNRPYQGKPSVIRGLVPIGYGSKEREEIQP